MGKIKIFSVYNIDNIVAGWRRNYPEYEIERLTIPTKDCYVIFKYNLKNSAHHPIDAIIGAQRGYVEGFIKKEFSTTQIFTPMEFENVILKNESEMPSRQADLNQELKEVILELMHKNEQLMVENAQLRAKLIEHE